MAEEGGGGIGEYDMEDDFIDDDEFADFVEGDLRKPKESGFFINKVGHALRRGFLSLEERGRLHDDRTSWSQPEDWQAWKNATAAKLGKRFLCY